MAVVNTYSKRLKMAASSGEPEVYRYDRFPDKLRVQVVHIWVSAIGNPGRETKAMSYSARLMRSIWTNLHNTLAREHGVFELADGSSAFDRCVKFLRDKHPVEQLLDLVELSLKAIHSDVRELDAVGAYKPPQGPDEAIAEFNIRCRENGFGYQFVNGQIIRIDSQLVHSEVVLPALALLADQAFKGPNDEFMEAHTHYRAREYEPAIVAANKAFESTLKVICDQRGWRYNKDKDTASALVEVVIKEGLFPEFLEDHIKALRTLLQLGLPRVRNRQGGHGQGQVVRDVPDYLAAHAIHLAAANIIFLVEAHKALP